MKIRPHVIAYILTGLLTCVSVVGGIVLVRNIRMIQHVVQKRVTEVISFTPFVSTTAPEPEPTPLPLSLDRIFSDTHTLPDTDDAVRLVATGDVLLGREVNYRMLEKQNFRWPFEKVSAVLQDADLTMINLETPVLHACPPTHTGMVFCADGKSMEGLTYAGVDLATIGNNHMGNHGAQGAQETKDILNDAGIVPVGDEIVYKQVQGIRFAFLSYNDIGSPEEGVPWADDMRVQEAIAEAHKNADIVIVAFHWGVEYVTEPSDRQRDLAHMAIDAGADVVVGNHPHWIQPVELYQGGVIAYAHGNFVFDQEWSEETKTGVVGIYTFVGPRIADVEFVPVRIEEYGQPYILSDKERESVLRAMYTASVRLISE